MKYIRDLKEGNHIQGVYLCKTRNSAVTKNGKNYENVTIQDRTGQLDCKIWEPNSAGIEEFSALDYIFVTGTVSEWNGGLQGNLRQVRKASEGEYIPADYVPVTEKNRKALYAALVEHKDSVREPHLRALLDLFFSDKEFMTAFYNHSAAKSIHHSFVGGLREHTVSVANLCAYMAAAYPVLNRDLLMTAAMLHDIGKIEELSDFPINEYTDDGQLLGHIVIGTGMISDRIREIPDFPKVLRAELLHCILAHHGEYEYGSPKKPAIIEAMALNLADNMDAKMETWSEIMAAAKDSTEWLGYNRLFESNLRRTYGPAQPEDPQPSEP